MFGIFKDIFRPKSVVGLQIDGSRIHAVQIGNPGGSPAVERLLRHEADNPAEMGKEMLEFFQKEKLRPEVIYSSIPTSRAVIREIALPLKNLKKLEKIIKYQAEPYIPWPIEETLVDFLPAEAGEPILVMAVPKSILAEHLAVLTAASLESNLVTLEDTALFHLFNYLCPEKKDQPTAIAHLREGETVIQIVYRQKPVLMRVVLDGASDFRFLKESLALYRMRKPDLPVAEILVTGAQAVETGLTQKIEALTGISTSLWKPLAYIKNMPPGISDHEHAELSVPLALAVGPMHAMPKALDLRKEEFSLQTPFELKNVVVYAMGALILLMGLLTYNTHHRLSLWQKQYQMINAQLANTLKETFPGAGVIIRGRELEQLKQKIALEKDRYRWLENISASSSVLDVLSVLTQTFSLYPEVTVDNISLEGVRILLDGRAATFKTVDSLKGTLEKSEFFKSIRLVGAKMDSQDGMVRFGFHLEKKK